MEIELAQELKQAGFQQEGDGTFDGTISLPSENSLKRVRTDFVRSQFEDAWRVDCRELASKWTG